MIICKSRSIRMIFVAVVVFVVIVVIVVIVVVTFRTRRKTEKEMEENIWRRKIADDANRPTNTTNIVQSAFSNVGK